MKYTITHVAEWILLAILAVLCIYTAYKSYQIKDKVEYITIQDTIQVTDTISNWVPYDVYHYKYDTAYLPIVDTINDTIIKLDSVLVQLPLDIYKFDSIIEDSAHMTHVEATVSGFNVEMQELSIDTKIIPQKPKRQPWYKNICPAAGVGVGTGGQIGLFLGLGYKL